MIRFQRIGRTNDPAFRIVLLEKERAAKTGRINEQLGTYNPKSKALSIREDRIKYWIKMGAQPTDSIHNLLVSKGVIDGKKVNVLPKKTPQIKEKPAEVASAAPVAAEPVAEALPAVETEVAVEAPTEAEVVAEALPAEAPAQAGIPETEAAAVPAAETEVASASAEEAALAEEAAPETPVE